MMFRARLLITIPLLLQAYATADAQIDSLLTGRRWFLHSIEYDQSVHLLPDRVIEEYFSRGGFTIDFLRTASPAIPGFMAAAVSCRLYVPVYRLSATGAFELLLSRLPRPGDSVRCSDVDIRNTEEVFARLARLSRYRVDSTKLELFNVDSTIVAHFSVVPPDPSTRARGAEVQLINLRSSDAPLDLFADSVWVASSSFRYRASDICRFDTATHRIAIGYGPDSLLLDTTLRSVADADILIVVIDGENGEARTFVIPRTPPEVSDTVTYLRLENFACCSRPAGLAIEDAQRRTLYAAPEVMLGERVVLRVERTTFQLTAANGVGVSSMFVPLSVRYVTRNSVPEAGWVYILTGDPPPGHFRLWCIREHQSGIREIPQGPTHNRMRWVNLNVRDSIAYAVANDAWTTVRPMSVSPTDSNLLIGSSLLLRDPEQTWTGSVTQSPDSMATTLTVWPAHSLTRPYRAYRTPPMASPDSARICFISPLLECRIRVEPPGRIVFPGTAQSALYQLPRFAPPMEVRIYVEEVLTTTVLGAFRTRIRSGESQTVFICDDGDSMQLRLLIDSDDREQSPLPLLERIPIPDKRIPTGLLRAAQVAAPADSIWAGVADSSFVRAAFGEASAACDADTGSYESGAFFNASGTSYRLRESIAIGDSSLTVLVGLGGAESGAYRLVQIGPTRSPAPFTQSSALRVLNGLADIDGIDVRWRGMNSGKQRLWRDDACGYEAAAGGEMQVDVLHRAGSYLFGVVDTLKLGHRYTLFMTGTTRRPLAYLMDDDDLERQVLRRCRIVGLDTSSASIELPHEEFQLIATPSRRVFELDIPSDGAEATINVADILGRIILTKREVRRETRLRLELRDAPTGPYVVSVSTHTGTWQKMIVVTD